MPTCPMSGHIYHGYRPTYCLECELTVLRHRPSRKIHQSEFTAAVEHIGACVEPDTYLLVDFSDSEEEVALRRYPRLHRSRLWSLLWSLGQMTRWLWLRCNRWRTNIMFSLVFILATYIIFFETPARGHIPEDAIDIDELEAELEIGHPVRLVTFKSPLNDKIYALPISNKSRYLRDYSFESRLARVARYHRLWEWADRAIGPKELFPEDEKVDDVISALQTAPIVNVDVLDIGKYESGTSEKWVVTLEGGQKAMMKLMWEEKGTMKISALCNYGYEMPAAEIAGFHLHRILGFRNTPYVSGRVVDLRREVLPVASPSVARQIKVKSNNETCVVGKCFFCKSNSRICPGGALIEVSMAYWVPRILTLHTYPPEYMPYSTPSMKDWKKMGFNNRSYCDKVRKTSPYDEDYFYWDLFDFAVLDTLMYHFDTKHYSIDDDSSTDSLTVRLDHGRAFCAYDRDDEDIFMAPLTQCCTLRKSTWENIQSQQGGLLTRKLRQRLERDPLYPVLVEEWYPVLERRLKLIIDIMNKCAHANGGWENVLVDT